LWLYHSITFSVCRQDIIGYTTVNFIGIGEVGGVVTTGADIVGIEITPDTIGVAENFIGCP
jgi:hypothetical protein